MLWIGLGLAILGGAIPVVLYWLGGARPETPDIEGFLAGDGPAYESPPLLARLRNLPASRASRDRRSGLMEAASAPVPSPCEAAGPAIFAYDGSDLAAYAIEQAGIQLAPGREALVVCVWQPADVGFVPRGGAKAPRGRGQRGRGSGEGDRRARRRDRRARRASRRRR